MTVEEWWNENSMNDMFSGGVKHLDWDELWPDAKEAVIELFNSARRSLEVNKEEYANGEQIVNYLRKEIYQWEAVNTSVDPVTGI